MLSEFRELTIKTVDGGTMRGKDLFDPLWTPMIAYHTGEAFEFSRNQTRDSLQRQIMALDGGEKLFAKFESLEHRALAAE